MKIEELLKIFHKYGFNSYKKEPFLYDGKEGVGIVFTIKHPFYGSLDRVYLPGTSEDAEKFLSTYYDYKKNKKKLQIDLKEYKSKLPDIYIENEEPLEELNVDEVVASEQNYIKKLKRTFSLLLKIIEEKIEVQNTTYENLLKLTNEYIQKQNEYNEKMSEIEKKPFEKIEDYPEQMSISSTSIEDWRNVLQETQDKNVLETSIHTLVDFIKNLELDQGLLKNKYEIIKLPLEMNLIKEKLTLLESPLYKKKGIFSKKEKLETALQELEEKSTLKNIVTFEHYEENERKRIEEKYAIIPDLDIRTVADYLIEFDNLKIEEPQIEEPREEHIEQVKSEYTFEDTMKHLENAFLSRKKEDQDLIVAFAYLTKNILNHPNPEKAVEAFLTRMQNPNNIMMQVKYFKNIDFSNKEKCLASIQKLVESVLELEPTNILSDINVFFKDNKRITASYILKTSTKRLLAPYQNQGENDCTYIATLKKDSEVYFIPEEIVTDMNEDTLLLKKETPYLFIHLQNHDIKMSGEESNKVVEYELEKETNSKVTIVHDLKSEKVNLYQSVTIERKEQ